jgi:hypothetical protein
MSLPRGVLLRVDTIDRDGEHQRVDELVVTLEEKTIDVRLNDDDDTIVMLNLDEVKEAIKTLERWERER